MSMYEKKREQKTALIPSLEPDILERSEALSHKLRCVLSASCVFQRENTSFGGAWHYYTRVPGFSGIGRTREGARLQDHIWVIFKKMKTLCDIEGEISNWTN